MATNNGYGHSSRQTTYREHSNSSSQRSSESWPSAYPNGSAPMGHEQQYLPMNQYSTLANYDGSYSRRRISQPPPPSPGTHMPLPTMPSSGGVPVVPSNVPGNHHRSNSMAGTSSSKTFVCEICGQSFTRAHDRKRHAQIHTRDPNEGPRCEWCKKKFSRDDALKRHIDHGCDDMPDEVYAQRRVVN